MDPESVRSSGVFFHVVVSGCAYSGWLECVTWDVKPAHTFTEK